MQASKMAQRIHNKQCSRRNRYLNDESLITDIQDVLDSSLAEMKDLLKQEGVTSITEKYVFDWVTKYLGFLFSLHSRLVDVRSEKSLTSVSQAGDGITYIRIRKFHIRELKNAGIIVI